MTTGARFGRLYHHKDIRLEAEIDNLYQALQHRRLNVQETDLDELAIGLGQAFRDGQILALNRFIDGVTIGKGVKLAQASDDYCLYAIKQANTHVWPTVYFYNDSATKEVLEIVQDGNGDAIKITASGTGKYIETDTVGCDCDNTGTWNSASSVTLKEGFREIEDEEILTKAKRFPVSEWRYKKAPDRKHIGPYAEDMKSVFGIGNGDGLSSMDVAGISLRLGQALLRKVEELEKRVEELESKE